MKTRVRLLGNCGREIGAGQFLRGLLPALWDDADLAAAVAAAAGHVRGSAALRQCPHCGGVYVDDPTAGKAGQRGMRSLRQSREGFAATPRAAVAAWALPEALAT